MKGIWVVCLGIMIGLAIFASAKMTPLSDESLSNKVDYDVEVSMRQGWNLIVRTPIVGTYISGTDSYDVISSDSEIKKENIRAVYYYFRQENKYLQVYPNNQELEDYLKNAQSKQEELIYLAQGPMWVYVDKTGLLKYQVEDFPTKYDEITLKTGWNFVGIGNSAKGKSFNEIKGNCAIEKIYHFEPIAQGWSPNFATSEWMSDKSKFNDESSGRGLVVKVTNDCKLGEEVPSVPALP